MPPQDKASTHSHPSVARRVSNWARGARRWQVFLLAFGLVFGLHATWSLLTPLGGSPDEIAHIAKAAGVAHGQIFGEDVDGTQLREFQIPAGIRASTDSVVCTILHGNVPANCVDITVGAPDELIPVITSAGLYNPVYYWIVGWPSAVLTGDAAVYTMRLLSGLLNAVFFGLALTCLSALPRARLPLLAGIGFITPTIAFLGGMVNPNILEVSTIAAFTSALILALARESRGAELWRLCAIMAVSGALATHARSLAPLWILAAVVIIAIISGWRRFWGFLRQVPTLLAVAAVIVAGAIALLVTLNSGTLNEMGNYPGQGTPWRIGLRKTLLSYFNYIPPMVGAFGWNDAVIPDYAIYATVGLALVLVAAALVAANTWRARIGVLLATASVAVLPAIVQGASVTKSGYIWQGRYGLAIVCVMVLCAAVVASVGFERLQPYIARRTIGLVLGVLALSHVGGMQVLLQRYATGVESQYSDLFQAPQWTPLGLPILVPISLIWVIIALWALAGWVLVSVGERPERDVDVDADADGDGPSDSRVDASADADADAAVTDAAVTA